MRKLLWLAAASVVALPVPALAQKDAGPALEVRVRSVNDLAGKFEYLGDVLNQGEQAKQLAGLVRNLADGKKGIEGIDPAKPTGLYATLTANVVDSPVVLMVPVADEEAFLGLLTGKLNLEPKKGDGGLYEVRVPGLPVPVYFRFAHGYAYAAAGFAASVDPKSLVDPKEYFAVRDDAVASARLHLGRIPADVKKTIYGQFELRMAQRKEEKVPGETPAQRKLRHWAYDQLTAAAAAVVADGRDLSVRLLAEPKTDELTAEVAFAARDGSPLARWVRGLSEQTGIAAALTDGGPAAARVGAKLALPIDAKLELDPVIDALVKEAIVRAKGAEQQATKLALDAVTPTLKTAELDAGLVLLGPDRDGRFTPLAGMRVTDGKRVEKTLRQFAPFIPEATARFQFDVKKAGGLALHRVEVPNPDLRAAFGSETVWLGVSDELVLVSVEPAGQALAAAAERLAGKERKARLFAVELHAAELLPLVERGVKPDRMRELTAEAFPGGAAGKDAVRLTLDGGDTLTLRLVLKGRAVKLAGLVDQEKKK